METTILGKCYRSFLRILSIIAYFPTIIAYKLAPLFAQYAFSPIDHEQPIMKKALQNAGYLFSPKDWQSLWKKHLADHAIFCLNIFKHSSFNTLWVKQHVKLDDKELNTLIKTHKSVLFLTYHHNFSHSLAVVLGSSGHKVNCFVAPEESSEIFEFIGIYIKRLHHGCTQHFNGGKYLFFNKNSTGAHITRRAFIEGGILVAANDIPSGSKKSPAINFLGRTIYPPIGNVRLACKMKIPIVAGLMVRDGQNYKLISRQLNSQQNTELIMTEYFSFLKEIIMQYPGIWDGWNFFSSLPVAVINNESIT